MLGLYTHIPFCESKCTYCDFYSITDHSLKAEYAEAICREMESVFDNSPADTLYFGGGTPTTMGSDLLGRIISKAVSLYGLKDAEITIEANPDTVTASMLSELREFGCNRISFGMQSADENELRVLGRAHTAEQVDSAVSLAKAAGFENISVDIMLGIPYQTVESLEHTIDFTHSLGVQHVSAYMLTVEAETPLAYSLHLPHCPDDEQTAELYLYTLSRLEAMGFSQYEISNFSLTGFESKHNLKYWLCQPYFGFGCAAHSFDGRFRYGHSRDIKAYLKHGADDRPYFDRNAGGWDEVLMLGLRLNRGVDLGNAEKNYAFDKNALLKQAEKYSASGLMNISGDTISLTSKGFLVSNEILANLVDFL